MSDTTKQIVRALETENKAEPGFWQQVGTVFSFLTRRMTMREGHSYSRFEMGLFRSFEDSDQLRDAREVFGYVKKALFFMVKAKNYRGVSASLRRYLQVLNPQLAQEYIQKRVQRAIEAGDTRFETLADVADDLSSKRHGYYPPLLKILSWEECDGTNRLAGDLESPKEAAERLIAAAVLHPNLVTAKGWTKTRDSLVEAELITKERAKEVAVEAAAERRRRNAEAKARAEADAEKATQEATEKAEAEARAKADAETKAKAAAVKAAAKAAVADAEADAPADEPTPESSRRTRRKGNNGQKVEGDTFAEKLANAAKGLANSESDSAEA